MDASSLNTNLVIQYILVGAILLAATVWIVWKIIAIKRNGAKSCCGCSLSQTCGKKQIKQRKEMCCTLESEKQHRHENHKNLE